jgi:hypothetical protein
VLEVEDTTPRNAVKSTRRSPETPAHGSEHGIDTDQADNVQGQPEVQHQEYKSPIHSRVVEFQVEKSPISARIHTLFSSPQKDIPNPHKESTPSSEDEFPSIEELLSQHSTTSGPANPELTSKISKDEREYEKAVAKADEELDDSNTTPTPSQRHNHQIKHTLTISPPELRVANSRTIKNPSSTPPLRPCLAEPKPSQIKIPPASLMIDLTQTSSEAEAEASEESDVSQPFKNYNLDALQNDDDNDFEIASGWAPKKTSTIPGVGVKVKTERGLKSLSQASLNKQNMSSKPRARF